jgi:hypothetical protein
VCSVYVIAAAPISYGLRVEASIAIARGALQQRVGSLGEGRRQDDCTEQLLGHRVITEAIGPRQRAQVRVLLHNQAGSSPKDRQPVVLEDLGVDV